MTTTAVPTTVEQFVRQTVAQILNQDGIAPSCRVDMDTFDLDVSIQIGLGGDGLDLVSILIVLEREYNIALSDINGEYVTTREIINVIQERIAS